MRARVVVPLIAIMALAMAASSCSGSSTTTSSGSGASTSAAASNTSAASTTGPSGSAPKGSLANARPSKGCAEPAPAALTAAGEAQHATLMVDGVDHPVRSYVPRSMLEAPKTPVPLVLDLHGLTEKNDEQAAVSGWEKIAERDGFVVLTPQGGGKVPSWAATLTDNPDYNFLQTLIDKTETELCIDLSRVYSGGISNGGLMSSILSCRGADQFAAVGLVSGIVVPEECKTKPPMPAIIFWGMRDCVLPYYGGLGPCLFPAAPPVPTEPQHDTEPPAVEDNVAFWAKRNGCNATPEVAKVSEHVEKRTYTGCKDDAPVELYIVSNGGHTWPGSPAAIAFEGSKGKPDPDNPKGVTTTEIITTDLMWEFFQRFQS